MGKSSFSELRSAISLEAILLRRQRTLGEDEVDFSMVDDPFASLNGGGSMQHTQLARLMRRPDEHEKIVTNRKTFHLSDLNALRKSDRQETETWEDGGGTYAKCALSC